ncbi:MAG TPA: septation protein A [Rhizomicrobium sp.]|nr:septation protein A [Rhizomicrobium sp.]
MNPQLRRLALDLGPLLIFFAAFKYLGIFGATAAFIVAVLVALGLGYLIEKRLSPIPLFTAVLVVIFGGLTLYLQNEVFIKMKPTVLYGFFGAVLLGGLAFNRLFIKYVFAQAFELDERGWKKLTVRWGLFFLCLAVINETVWRSTSTATWVSFKVWGIIPLIFLFALAQTPLVIKHQTPQSGDSNTQQ